MPNWNGFLLLGVDARQAGSDSPALVIFLLHVKKDLPAHITETTKDRNSNTRFYNVLDVHLQIFIVDGRPTECLIYRWFAICLQPRPPSILTASMLSFGVPWLSSWKALRKSR